LIQKGLNSTGGAMVIVLDSSGVNRGFEPWLGQIKDYRIGICFVSAELRGIKR
jgi:hypothetical protein